MNIKIRTRDGRVYNFVDSDNMIMVEFTEAEKFQITHMDEKEMKFCKYDGRYYSEEEVRNFMGIEEKEEEEETDSDEE